MPRPMQPLFRNGPTTYIARSLDRRCSPN